MRLEPPWTRRRKAEPNPNPNPKLIQIPFGGHETSVFAHQGPRKSLSILHAFTHHDEEVMLIGEGSQPPKSQAPPDTAATLGWWCSLYHASSILSLTEVFWIHAHTADEARQAAYHEAGNCELWDEYYESRIVRPRDGIHGEDDRHQVEHPGATRSEFLEESLRSYCRSQFLVLSRGFREKTRARGPKQHEQESLTSEVAPAMICCLLSS